MAPKWLFCGATMLTETDKTAQLAVSSQAGANCQHLDGGAARPQTRTLSKASCYLLTC